MESTKKDEKVFARIEKEQGARGSKLKEYKFDMAQVEAFRYRMEDALRSVTRAAIKEARIKELKTEILNSDKLKVKHPVLRFMLDRIQIILSVRLTSRTTRWTSSICGTTNHCTRLAYSLT